MFSTIFGLIIFPLLIIALSLFVALKKERKRGEKR